MKLMFGYLDNEDSYAEMTSDSDSDDYDDSEYKKTTESLSKCELHSIIY